MIQHIQTDFGGLLTQNKIRELREYIVITMEIPWNLCKHFFEENQPKQVVMVDSLDKEKLDSISKTLPENVNIVGLGGGTAIDAAKYFAYLQKCTPILIPTITSTNAPFSDFISIKKDGSAFGFKKDGYPKEIIVDHELIGLSDARYNRAGYGDLLYMQTTLNDWMISAQKGFAEAVDTKIKSQILDLIQHMIDKAEEIGGVTEQGIYLLMENIKKSTDLYTLNSEKPISAGSEHLFAWNLEMVTHKEFVHGEIVALGIVISSFLQKNFIKNSRYQKLRNALDNANVIYRPEELGVSWDVIEETLHTVDKYNRKFRNFTTVFDFVEWTQERMQELKEHIYS